MMLIPVTSVRNRFAFMTLWVVLLGALLLLPSCGDNSRSNSTSRSSNSIGDPRLDEYVGVASCVQCHAEQHEKWKGSHHFHAMELPTPETVRGDFNNTTFERYGVVSRFFREGDKYMVETENERGEMEVFQVKHTFGWEPLQQYLVQFPDGRMQVLPTCWDIEGKRWYHIYPDEHIKPKDPLFWTRSMQNWDHMCADCHSTNLRKGYDPKTRKFSTSYSEMTVACEACHGPGRKHVELAKADDGWQGMPHYGLADVNSSSKVQVESCAKCHARRGFVHPGHHVGSKFLDHFLPEVAQPWAPDMSAPTYHVDGQIDDEVYVFGSFIQSKMFHKGVKCADCHDPHTARTYVKGNQLCMRCHSPKPDNLTLYDSPAHHFHPMGTKGAQCVECHMPEKTYMVVDPRRDHSIRIPRPDLSVKFGTPNACNRCHDDKDAAWAAGKVEEFKGPNRPREVRHPEAFHAFRNRKPEAEKLLLDTVRDLESPSFTRSGALLALRRFLGPASFAEARTRASDPDPVIRVAAVNTLENLPDNELKQTLGPILNDPILSVRTEAARVLSRLPSRIFTPEEKKQFDIAFRELKARFLSNLDRPEANLSLGNLAENQGNPRDAERYYKAAIEREETFIPARMNLATLLNRRGRNREAEKLLRQVVRLQPDWGQGHYSLGLLLAEDRNRLDEAAQRLSRAASIMPENPRIHFNLGVAYWQLEQRVKAASAIKIAYKLEPANPEFSQALAQLYGQENRWKDALPYAEKVVELMPGNSQAKAFLAQVRARSVQR
jgi:predicted CXXCH cytochrome family protein